ncbi:MAG: ABC transporter permease [Acidimicrobiia bacterium]
MTALSGLPDGPAAPTREPYRPAHHALGRAWSARWLLVQWVRRDFTVQYRQSLLGVTWALAQPLLLLASYGVVFSQVLGVQAPEGSYVVFALCGLVPWTFLATAVNRGVASLMSATHIIRQVYFPRCIVPLASTGVTVVDLALGTVVLLVAQLATAHTVHLATLALVPIYLSLTMLMAGVAVFLSLIGALVRDLRFVIPLLIQAGFIATPVMYPQSQVPDRFRWVYDYNPVARVIEAVRGAVIEGQWPSATLLVSVFAAAVAVLGLAIWYCGAVEDRLPDLL